MPIAAQALPPSDHPPAGCRMRIPPPSVAPEAQPFLPPPTVECAAHLAARIFELAVQDAFGLIPSNQARNKGRGLEWGRADLQATALCWIIGTTPEDRADFLEICDRTGGDPMILRIAVLEQIQEAGILSQDDIDRAERNAWPPARMRELLLARRRMVAAE